MLSTALPTEEVFSPSFPFPVASGHTFGIVVPRRCFVMNQPFSHLPRKTQLAVFIHSSVEVDQMTAVCILSRWPKV